VIAVKVGRADPTGAVSSADLGGSSDDSRGRREGQSGEGFREQVSLPRVSRLLCEWEILYLESAAGWRPKTGASPHTELQCSLKQRGLLFRPPMPRGVRTAVRHRGCIRQGYIQKAKESSWGRLVALDRRKCPFLFIGGH